jgi:hypothetical protein
VHMILQEAEMCRTGMSYMFKTFPQSLDVLSFTSLCFALTSVKSTLPEIFEEDTTIYRSWSLMLELY